MKKSIHSSSKRCERPQWMVGVLSLPLLITPTLSAAADVVPAELPVVRTEVQSDTFVLTGTVVDDQGEPLIGARVSLVENTSKGTMTDIDGAFRLPGVQLGQTAEVAFVGYKTQRIKLQSKDALHITLLPDNELLDEVVVVGYGTQKKVNLTGSVATIDTKEINNRANANVLSSLQGAIPGVTIISRPGSTPSINFRGRGNLGSSEPLYVIDGSISTATEFSNLDPNAIESISFLKDAASSSIYGSRAAYGVVLVTTKSGEKGAVRVHYNGMVGFKNPTYVPKTVSSGDYAMLMNEAVRNTNPDAKPVFSDEEIGWFRDGSKPDQYPNSNWYDLILQKNVMTTQHSASVSGGEKVRFYTGLGYVRNNHFLPGRSSDRYNVNANFTTDVKSWLTLRGSLNAIQIDNDRKLGTPGYTHFINIPATFVGRHSDGSFGTIQAGKPASKTSMNFNPIREVYDGSWSNSRTRILTMSSGIDISPVDGLKVSGDLSYHVRTGQSKSYDASRPSLKLFGTGEEIVGTSKEASESKMTVLRSDHTHLIANLVANYGKTFGEVHEFGALAGTSFEDIRYDEVSGWRKLFPNNNLQDIHAGSDAPSNMNVDGGMSQTKLFSVFGRLNYAYASKYLAEINVRSDASSRFHKDHRTALFPSFSLGWRLSEEDFMKDFSWIYNLKLRASYGTLGNINNVGNYDYLSTYGKGSSYIFDQTVAGSYVESKPANESLSWEKVAITDIGLDLGLWDNRLTMTLDYYNKLTTDILLTPNIPVEIGLQSKPSQNLGEVLNKGFEAALTWSDHVGDFHYSLGGNLSINKNEILNLGDSDPIIEGAWIKKVGRSIGEFYMYKTDGLLTQEDIDKGNYITDGITPKAGDIKYVDMNDNKKLDGDDRTFVGNDVPWLTYGLNLYLAYKGFDLTVAGQGIAGTKVSFESEMAHAFFDYANPREYHLGRWTKENPNPQAVYPRIYDRTDPHAKFNQYASDFWLFNSDYFRIKNITLGYSLPQSLTDTLTLSQAKIFLSLENFITFRGDHRMKDFDPEAATGRAVSALGEKTVSLGVNVAF